jgi:drug/metabolite transporter (DMT)-like permease
MNDSMTPTRFLVGGLQFFGVAIALALALTALAPIASIRGIAAIGLGCAVAGFALELGALRRMDPHTLSVIGFRIREAVRRLQEMASTAAEAIHAATAAMLSKPAR